MGVVEALLVFTVTAFHLAVMPGCIRTDQLVLNALEFQCFFKHRFALAATAMGKSIREFEAVICLDTLNPDTFSPELSNYSAQELIRGIGALFRVSPKDPVTGILINTETGAVQDPQDPYGERLSHRSGSCLRGGSSDGRALVYRSLSSSL